MNRRDFLQFASLTMAGSMIPGVDLLADARKASKVVVLVHLDGGNDGFNTLVPYADEAYYALRPKIAIKDHHVIKLQDGFGMHSQLKPLEQYWKNGEMAWVQGLGYPNAILSHFKSLDVWESGSVNRHAQGWLADVLPKYKQGLHGVVMGGAVGGNSVMKGSELNAVTMQNPKSFIKAASRISDIEISRRNPAIAHVSNVQHQLHQVGKQIAERVGPSPKGVPGRFSGELGHGLEAVAQMILSGVDAPVYKVRQDGFDTHSGQITAQSNSLFQLANGLNSFANVMKRSGKWNDVIVVTYSEFGRRAKENRGQGTDHGTASAQLVMGGSVKRGIYGKHPDLTRLDGNGNVAHTTDFRSIYATLSERWWRQGNPWKGHASLPFV